MSFHKETTPVGKKHYGCEWCHDTILKGEKHVKISGVQDDDLYDYRMHSSCKDQLNRVKADCKVYYDLLSDYREYYLEEH